jgi:hypothetical protein
LRYEIVIAGDAQHRLVEAREYAPEVFVASRVILHEVAGDQDRIADGEMTRGVGERTFQRFEGVHAAKRASDVAKQMGVRELDDSDGTHSFELYKHDWKGRVMYVTGRFTAL